MSANNNAALEEVLIAAAFQEGDHSGAFRGPDREVYGDDSYNAEGEAWVM